MPLGKDETLLGYMARCQGVQVVAVVAIDTVARLSIESWLVVGL